MRRPFQVLPNDCAASSMTRQLVPLRDGVEPVAVDRQPRKIDRNDRPRRRRDRGFDPVQIEIARHRVDIDEDRFRAHFENHVAGRHPGKRRGDDFVPRANPCDPERDFHRASAGIENPDRPPADVFA